MPPQAKKPEPAAAPVKAVYVPPRPTQVVVWRHVPGGDPVPAVVTHIGRQGISVMIFPPDSRVGVPKEAVRHVSDPMVRTQVSPDAGVWDYPDETKLVFLLAERVIPDGQGNVAALTPEETLLAAKLLGRFTK